MRRAWQGAAVAALALAACDSGPERPEKGPPPPPPRPEATSAAPSTSAPPSASASAAPRLSAAPGGAGLASLAGRWEGSYDAKKSAVEMPPKVKDKARAADDGKAAAGPGKVTLTITADGDVSGKASGALGEATLSGRVDADGAAIRASWFADDPTAKNAMTGVLIGLVKGEVIAGEIRVAGPDAVVVRESAIELKRR